MMGSLDKIEQFDTDFNANPDKLKDWLGTHVFKKLR